jgi:hypothetical protein
MFFFNVIFFFSLLQEDPQLVSLHWLLGEVGRQMGGGGGGEHSRFIVDIMPNLKFLINNDIFLSDCTNDMVTFEKAVSADYYDIFNQSLW